MSSSRSNVPHWIQTWVESLENAHTEEAAMFLPHLRRAVPVASSSPHSWSPCVNRTKRKHISVEYYQISKILILWREFIYFCDVALACASLVFELFRLMRECIMALLSYSATECCKNGSEDANSVSKLSQWYEATIREVTVWDAVDRGHERSLADSVVFAIDCRVLLLAVLLAVVSHVSGGPRTNAMGFR